MNPEFIKKAPRCSTNGCLLAAGHRASKHRFREDAERDLQPALASMAAHSAQRFAEDRAKGL